MKALAILAFACLFPCIFGGKFLFLPFPFGSHISHQFTIGLELMKKGHEVHIVISDSFADKSKYEGKGIIVHGHHTPKKDGNMLEVDDMMAFWETSIGIDHVVASRVNFEYDYNHCENLLTDDTLYNKLRSVNFDMGMLDAFTHGRCFVVLFYRLGIPFVSQTTVYEPWLLRNPAPPSYVPINMLKPRTPNMNFWERLSNLYEQLDWFISPRVEALNDEMVAKYAPEKPYVTLNKLVGESLLWLIDTDLALDYPRPMMPNEMFIGGLTTKAGKPLSAELEEFMSSNPLGTIVVSFGSIGMNLPQDMMDRLYSTFKRVKYNVIWRYPMDQPADVPKHIKLMTWMPQNDLLAHNNTKLFITHCGNGGQFEGLYNAVPMIGFPLFGDQPYNAKRVVYKGFGEELNIKRFTEDELEAAIHKVIENPSYKEAISSASAVYRSQPMTALQRAVWWIEHVLHNGGHHYRAYALDMPWYQYLMLDIFGFLAASFAITVLIVWFCVSTFIIPRRNGKQKMN